MPRRCNAKSSRPKASSLMRTDASTSSVTFGYRARASGRDTPPGEQARNRNHDDGANHGDQQAGQVEAHHHVVMRDQTPQEAANERADHAKDEIADEPIAATTHDQP